MELMDRVLSHMNEPDHDLLNYSDLEKLAHAAHMQDIWQGASARYMDIQCLRRGFNHIGFDQSPLPDTALLFSKVHYCVLQCTAVFYSAILCFTLNSCVQRVTLVLYSALLCCTVHSCVQQ